MKNVIAFSAFCTLMIASNLPAQESTWQTVQSHVLNGNCASCHSEGNSFARQSDLVLTPDVAYEQLVEVLPANLAARNDGLTRVSTVGGPAALEQSFLWEKINVAEQQHFYDDHANYGALMPLGLPPLTNGELDFVKEWILQGAPQTGVVADPALLLDTSRFEPPEFRSLTPPENGFQLSLGPFDVWSSEKNDREFLYYEPFDTDEDLFIERYEISYREGSHHFILYNYPDGESAPNKEREFRDIRNQDGRINLLTAFEIGGLFPQKAFILSQSPYTNYRFPPGVALRLPAGQGFDMNSHSVNRSGETRQSEVQVNIHTIDESEVIHVAENGNFGDFDFRLPPNQVTTLSNTFAFEETSHILQMFSHAHEKMTEFRIEHAGGEKDGELIYWTNDWEHPPILEFNPPLKFERGERVRLVTTYNNDTNDTVRFGLLSTDEMQIMFYTYYTGDFALGDFDADGQFDVGDIDLLVREMRRSDPSLIYDLNEDSMVNASDLSIWVEDVANTFFGDANLDGEFNTGDLVEVFQAGEYEDAQVSNSTWSEGDWNGDGDFNTSDLVLAFQAGGFEKGPKPVTAVPEPSSLCMLIMGVLAIGRRRAARMN